KDASVRVTVNMVVSQAPPSEMDLFAKNVKDVFFDFDKANIRPDEEPTASGDASFLTQHPSIMILIEGHCDDRGSEEYNIALGQSRAQTLKNHLQRWRRCGAHPLRERTALLHSRERHLLAGEPARSHRAPPVRSDIGWGQGSPED